MHHPKTVAQLARLAAWLLISAALTACSLVGGNNRQLGGQTVLEGEVVLICSDTCASRGQCGESLDRGRFVFAHQAGPAVSEHDTALPAGTRATVLEPPRQVLLEQISNGQQLPPIYFYHVALVDPAQQGWVAGWCVATP